MNIRMSTKGKRPLRSLTPSDKVHAIQRIHDGESKASVARDIGVPESTLRGWCKNEDKLRFMSRQSAAEKMGGESLAEKLDGSANHLGGPPEKRQRLDSAMPLNFSNKMKFDELAAFKRAPLSGLDFGSNKALTDLSSFNGLTPDYGAFNGSAKNKVFGADISRPTDPSMAAISPLSSLSHLSGLTGLSQSPLAISFNELTSNLNLLAQLNPGLAAMTGLNGLAATNNNLRNTNPKTKQQPQIHSPRSETTERQTGLTVKNWAKQKPLTPTSGDSSAFGLNLSQNESKTQLKNTNASLMPPHLAGNLPPLPALPEDPLLYWLKSQQAMLGLNNLYPPPPPLGATSPPIRSSTPQQQSLPASTPPIVPTPLTPSSTPSGSLDDKNSAWFNWCKAFGASLNSLAPNAAAAATLHGNALQHTPSSSITGESPATIDNLGVSKTGFENILYSHLTKDSAPSPSVQSSSSIEQINSEISNNIDMSNKPEDLSSKSVNTRSPQISPLPTPAQSPERNIDQAGLNNNSPTPSPIHIGSEGDMIDSEPQHNTRNSVADCRDVLDNLLYKINNNNSNSNRHAVSESEASYNSDHNNVDDCSHNNNNNSNKTDEEERAKCADQYEDYEGASDYRDAIKHGEKFLQWLENCSSPRVTAVQLMQLRFLISSVKTDLDPKLNLKETASPTNLSTAIEIDDSSEECNRLKTRRRK